MRRFLLLSLALLLLFCGCNRESSTFLRAEDGAGYTDTKRDIFYTALDHAYEPAGAGEARGTYTDRSYDRTLTFREITGLDPARFVTDDNRTVYSADPDFKTADQWVIRAVLACDENAVSIERTRLSAGSDDLQIAELRTLWFETAPLDADAYLLLALETPEAIRRIKLTTEAYPGLYYCFSLQVYEDGSAYFVDIESKHAVAAPAALATRLMAK